MYKILVVEDDGVITRQIQKYLAKWGYEVECVTDFRNVMAQFASFSPQLVLMDIGLPFYNGYYWCGAIRKVSQAPIIFISSASDNMNIVMAVNMGADDFLTKPFDLEVLQAKVQAVLRRAYAFTNTCSILACKGALLNVADMTVRRIKETAFMPENQGEEDEGKAGRESTELLQGRSVGLTRNEFRILQTLFEAAGNVVSREELMKRLWDDECFVDDNTLTVNINRLRRRLGEIGLQELIQTKKGVGYLLGECG